MVTLSLDMDGVIADFYHVPQWLDYLNAEETTPYITAKPLVNTAIFAYLLNRLQKNGYQLQIISWTSKNATKDFHQKITIAKEQWLKYYFPSVVWDLIQILPYGTPKEKYCYSVNDILIDDEYNNRQKWQGVAYDEKNILEILQKLLTKIK